MTHFDVLIVGAGFAFKYPSRLSLAHSHLRSQRNGSVVRT